MVAAGTLHAARIRRSGPNSYLALLRSVRRRARRGPHVHLQRAARTTRARPTTGSRPRRCARTLNGLFDGCMRGRTMYVVPFSMGPLGSPIAHIGIELSDSPYVVVNMQLMTRMGRAVFDVLGSDGAFVPCVHSVGAPLAAGQRDVAVAVQQGPQVHRAFSRDARDLELRLGLRRQRAARQEVLRAAHRVGDGPRPGLARRAHADPRRRRRPTGEKTLRRGRVPQRLRQDQFRDADSAGGLRRLEGHDDRRRHRVDQAAAPTARFYAINPEAGYFGVAPGTSYESNPNAMEMLQGERHLHQRRADRRRRRVVGRHDQGAARASHRLAGQGRGRRTAGRKAAHPNARFTVAATQCPSLDPALGRSRGRADLRVHLRRAALATPCRWWSRRASGRTASTRRRRWARRRPPRPPARSAKCAAIRSRCCRSAAITSATISRTGWRWASAVAQPPRIFSVNWFRKDANGKFVVARLRREHARAAVDRRALPRTRARASRRRSAWSPPTGISTGRALDFDAGALRAGDARRPRAVGARARGARRAVRQARAPSARPRCSASANGWRNAWCSRRRALCARGAGLPALFLAC